MSFALRAPMPRFFLDVEPIQQAKEATVQGGRRGVDSGKEELVSGKKLAQDGVDAEAEKGKAAAAVATANEDR